MWRWVFLSFHYVDDTGIEPVTPTMSMWCSTAEPIVLGILNFGYLLNYERVYRSCQSLLLSKQPMEVGTGFEPV